MKRIFPWPSLYMFIALGKAYLMTSWMPFIAGSAYLSSPIGKIFHYFAFNNRLLGDHYPYSLCFWLSVMFSTMTYLWCQVMILWEHFSHISYDVHKKKINWYIIYFLIILWLNIISMDALPFPLPYHYDYHACICPLFFIIRCICRNYHSFVSNHSFALFV